MPMYKDDEYILMESRALKLYVSKSNGSWRILHKPAGAIWDSNEGFCKLELYNLRSEELRVLVADRFKEIHKADGSIILVYEPQSDIKVNFRVEFADDETIRFSYSIERINSEWKIRSVNILDEAPKVIGDGYAVVPVGMGCAIPSTANINFETKGTYFPFTPIYEGGYLMRFLGLVKGAAKIGKGISAAVITWSSPDVNVSLRTERIEGKGIIIPTIVLTGNAREVNIHFIERGGFVDISKYYRKLVMKEGLFVTLEDKMKRSPNLKRLIRSVHFLPVCKTSLSERVNPDGALRWYRRDFSLNLKPGDSIAFFTFEELAKIAEHLKRKVMIEHAYFNIFGWMKGGHDRYYPDFLPADDELGGNSGLIATCNKLRSLDYLFSLYINPILQFEEAKSTDPDDAVTLANGRKYHFNFYAGGPSYIICPSRIIKHMSRVIPTMKRLFSPSVSYLDYMMAIPLLECHDPKHPLTREETIKHHREVLEYFRTHLADIVAAEAPYEYAVPALDFFYGWLNFKGRPGLVRVPLTELVYRECGVFSTWLANMARASNEAPSFMNEDLIDYISVGRTPLLYLPPHLYYERDGTPEVNNILYCRADGGWTQKLCPTDRLIKNAYEITVPLYEATFNSEMVNFEFLTPDHKVCKATFKDGTIIVANKSDGEFDFNGTIIPRHGFIAEGPTFIAFCAKRYNGIEYSSPALFTIRSLDNNRIERSKNLRIYHGFGDSKIAIKNVNSKARIGDSIIRRTGEYFIFDVAGEANVNFLE